MVRHGLMLVGPTGSGKSNVSGAMAGSPVPGHGPEGSAILTGVLAPISTSLTSKILLLPPVTCCPLKPYSLGSLEAHS